MWSIRSLISSFRMMNTLSLLLLVLSLTCVSGQSMESIPSSPVVKRPGETLSLSCRGSGFTFSSYGINWIKQPEGKGLQWMGYIYTHGSNTYYSSSFQDRIEITRDNNNNMVYLKLSNLRPEDSAVYYCARDWGGYWAFDYWGKGTTVTVTSATSKGPTVFPLMPCGSGGSDTVTLGCLATGFTPSALTFTWKQGSTSLDNFISYPSIQKGSEYMGISQIQVNRQDWDSKKPFECIANHAVGEQHASFVKPNVVYQMPTLTLSSFNDVDNQETVFSCFAKDFSPNKYEFRWLKNSQEIASRGDEVSTSSHGRNSTNGTMYSAASLLTVKTDDARLDDEFMCLFKGKGKNTVSVMNVTTTIKEAPCSTEFCSKPDVEIEIKEPSNFDMLVSRGGKLTCRVKINRGKFDNMYWEDENKKELVSTLSNGNRSFREAVLDITYDEWSQNIKRTCVVQHEDSAEPIKKVYKRQNGGPLQRPSVFMLPPLEQTRKNSVTLTCYVKDFFPHEVYVSWLVDDLNANSKYEFTTTDPIKINGTYYVYSQLTFPMKEWKQPDVAYSCVVYHESIDDSRTVIRSIGYRNFENTNLVNLNIPNMCKAQ